MSDTPRTDKYISGIKGDEIGCCEEPIESLCGFARQLERELSKYKHMYEQQSKANECQAEVIKLAEEMLPDEDKIIDFVSREIASLPEQCQ